MEDVCVYVKYNGQWDGTLRYVSGEMKGILVPETATYVGLIELVRSIRGPTNTIVMRYSVKPGLPLVRIQCDADIKFYIHLKKKDVHVLIKFPITIDVLDESAAEAIPPELGESNYIDVQLSREGVQNDEVMQHVDGRPNLIIPSPTPYNPHLPPHVDNLKFAVLPAWAEMVKRKNPRFDIDIETNSANYLQCFYMCLAASKHVWPYCRPVIVVDRSALKAKFGGMLLAACGHDVNGCIFPLAFANLVYPDAAFGICVQYLAANLKTKYKDFKGPLKTYFDGASRSYLLSEHHRHMEFIRNRNPDMHRYLVQADPTKWSRAYFNGRRYAIMTTNIAESLNNVDRKARLMPVGFLVEWLRELQQRWFFQRSDQFEYAVTNNASQIWIVDISEMTCTCRRFQVDQIPCPHAMAIFHPIGSADGWDVPEEVRSQIVNPPKTKCGPGRPRVRRILSQGEEHDLFGVGDVMVMDTTDKPIPIQYH
ncbi:hypothetical protein TIFTF001_015451 [Ficus carica]|uniref:SWIM-type domain-containing protein n=1 Tax=Ficus carica TaxID=3494 RepID=A0AA88A5P1_FICCA|nr:hypothetical protein TIFTF001_015451 [Ficus carica]